VFILISLAIASSQGQRIYTITQNNLFTALAALTFDDDVVKQEIQAQVTAGLVVTVHRDAINYAGWSGVGYTVIDPKTGAGAYKISGGSDGCEANLNSNIVGTFTILDLFVFLEGIRNNHISPILSLFSAANAVLAVKVD
jgi:hypothetical protein